MTSIPANLPMAQQMWQRFFDRADANADGTIEASELQVFASDENAGEKVDRIVSALDQDADGRISVTEAPSGFLDQSLLSPLLTAQEYMQSDKDARQADDAAVVAALFERADVHTDGVLSGEEWQAERTLRMANWLDNDNQDGPVFIIRRGADRSALKAEDFAVARRLPVDSAVVRKPEDLPQELQEALARFREMAKSGAPDRPTVAERKAQLEAGVRNADFSESLLSRLFAQLAEAAERTDISA